MARVSHAARLECSYLPPPSAQEDEDKDDHTAYEAKPQAHGRGVPGLEALEGLLPHQGAYDLARSGRPTTGDDVDVVEDQKRVDDRQQDDEHEGGPDPRQRHVDELLPTAGAVHSGGLVELVVNRLKGCQKQQYDEAPP